MMINKEQEELRADKLLTGSSKPVKFSNGIELWLKPLSDKDIAELDSWVRSYYLYTQRSTIPESLSEEDKDRIERIAQETASTLTWYSGLGLRIMISVDGMTQIVLQSLDKQKHEKITFDQVREILLSPSNLDAATEAFEELNVTTSTSTAASKKVNRGSKQVKKRPIHK